RFYGHAQTPCRKSPAAAQRDAGRGGERGAVSPVRLGIGRDGRGAPRRRGLSRNRNVMGGKPLPIKVEIFDTEEALDQAAARWLAARVRPGAVLGLATGGTPLGLYRRLVEMHRAGELSFAGVRSFNLDEYVGLASDHPQSYAAYMREHLFNWVDIEEGDWHIPDGANPDPAAEAARYDRLYWELGPVDAQILGIGTNGHIGFNEPGTRFEQSTHVVRLAQ